MIRAYVPTPDGLHRTDVLLEQPLPAGVVWIDLIEPTREEEKQVELALATNVPSREEMQEIEESSRLYTEGSAAYMTSTIINRADSDHPESSAITFLLVGDCLVTVRYADPLPFRSFATRAARQPDLCVSADTALIGLMEAITDRLADIIERIGADMDALSRDIFRSSRSKGTVKRITHDLQAMMQAVGQAGDLNSRAQESLLSLTRQTGFFRQISRDRLAHTPRGRLKTLIEDLQSLNDYVHSRATQVSFLLDATLGLINIQQNSIIKIFSVMAVVFLPPTLIASIYGMNFKDLPELSWAYGYPYALTLMVLSAVLPYMFFKQRGWL